MVADVDCAGGSKDCVRFVQSEVLVGAAGLVATDGELRVEDAVATHREVLDCAGGREVKTNSSNVAELSSHGLRESKLVAGNHDALVAGSAAAASIAGLGAAGDGSRRRRGAGTLGADLGHGRVVGAELLRAKTCYCQHAKHVEVARTFYIY